MMRVSYFYPKFATQNKSNEDKIKQGFQSQLKNPHHSIS